MHVCQVGFLYAESVEHRDRCGIIRAADAAHAEFLASQVFYSFDLIGDEKHVGKAIGSAGNQDGAGSLEVAGDHGGGAGMNNRSFPGNQGGNRERRADQEHQLDVEPLLRE